MDFEHLGTVPAGYHGYTDVAMATPRGYHSTGYNRRDGEGITVVAVTMVTCLVTTVTITSYHGNNVPVVVSREDGCADIIILGSVTASEGRV